MTTTDRLGRAMEAIEADMIALWARYNPGTVPAPEKIKEMIGALSTEDFVRMLNAKLEAQPEQSVAPFTYQG